MTENAAVWTPKVGERVYDRQHKAHGEISRIRMIPGDVSITFDNNEGFWTYYGAEIFKNLSVETQPELFSEPVAPAARADDVAELQRKLDAAMTALAPFAAFADAHRANGRQMWQAHPEFGIAYFEGITVTAGNLQHAADTLAALREAK